MRGMIWARWTLALGAAALLAVGCGGSDGDEPSGGDGGVDAGKGCLADNDCDDGNACTLDRCVVGYCTNAVVPDADAKEQTPGDCKKVVCTKGQPTLVNDDGDVFDDGEQCTQDSCLNGAPVHTAKLEGSKCVVGKGTGKCTKGQCLVLCSLLSPADVCDDENSCTDDACLPCDLPECGASGKCNHVGLSGMPTPGVSQTEGDCKERRCDNGKDVDAADPFDVPDDGVECTVGICSASGLPVNEPLPAGTSCSGSWVCDGKGKCVQCVANSDCTSSGSGTCSTATCEAGSCTSAYVPSGTPLPASEQVAGDCRVLVCNGSGSTTYQADPLDLPNDNNPCTSDQCVGTSAQHSYMPAGTSCGSGMVCNQFGSCCTPTTCAAQNRSCGTLSDGCGTTLNCGTCDPGDTCSGGQCGCKNGFKSGTETGIDCGGVCPKCALGLTCLAGSDCASGFCADGVCCNAACTGTCQACTSSRTGMTTGTCANVTTGTDPDNECPATAASTCGTTGMCGGGGCQMHASGTVCKAASCVGGTHYAADTCNGAGQCVVGAETACSSPYTCAGAACQTCSDGIKNGTEADVDCGSSASCSKCVNGKTCSAAADCASGFCVDGRCCNTACSGTCQRCNLAGNLGTCTPSPAGTDPDNECVGNKTCNGAGQCT